MRGILPLAAAFLFLTPPVSAQQMAPNVTSPDGKVIAKATKNTISFFDAATQKERARMLGHTGNVITLAFSPDGKFLASGGEDRGVRLWEVATGKEVRQHMVSDAVAEVSFSPDGKNLRAKTRDGKNSIFAVATGQKIQ